MLPSRAADSNAVNRMMDGMPCLGSFMGASAVSRAIIRDSYWPISNGSAASDTVNAAEVLDADNLVSDDVERNHAHVLPVLPESDVRQPAYRVKAVGVSTLGAQSLERPLARNGPASRSIWPPNLSEPWGPAPRVGAIETIEVPFEADGLTQEADKRLRRSDHGVSAGSRRRWNLHRRPAHQAKRTAAFTSPRYRQRLQIHR